MQMTKSARFARRRPDLVDADSPPGIEVIQITAEPDTPACHLYMEAQIFAPDSRRFVLHRSAHPHGSTAGDADHQYLLCDIDDGYALTPLTFETGVTGASLSPDGSALYYFVDRTKIGGGSLELKRVRLDGTGRETLSLLDQPIPGTPFRPSRIYPLSTIRSDGGRIAISCFLGDGTSIPAPFGLLVFDLSDGQVSLVLEGPTWCNVHPQYCRSTDASLMRDIMVQENHGMEVNAAGVASWVESDDPGPDIHVIRDDGSDIRGMPWGRDRNEFCQGHQCWRGSSDWAITSTHTHRPKEEQLIEGRALPDAGDLGRCIRGARRNDLTRGFPDPHFSHFATDRSGTRLITDADANRPGGRLFVARLGAVGEDAADEWRYLLSPRVSGGKGAHMHPFLSPDGRTGFFNSDESGRVQAYAVTGVFD